MNKQIMVLAFLLLIGGNVFAGDVIKETLSTSTNKVAGISVNNKICPLSGRELNLADSNDYTQLTVEGLSFNVCPIAMVRYKKDATPFADKLAAAIKAAKADLNGKTDEVMAEAPAVKEVVKEAAKEIIKEEVKVEEPKAEEPKAEEVKVEEQKVETPKVEEPAVQATNTESAASAQAEAVKEEAPATTEPVKEAPQVQ